MKILNNRKLKNYSTFKIGGTCKYFCEVKNVSEIIQAINFAKNRSLRCQIIGSGSNILFSDQNFNGLIIKNSILGAKKISESKDSKVYSFGSGYLLDSVIRFTQRMKLSGIENLSGIPGTIGGAVVQNSGACGVEIKNLIFAVEIFNTETNQVLVLKNKECEFSYRNSVFKQQRGHIILKVYVNLNKKFKPVLKHQQIRELLGGDKKISALSIRRKILELRSNKLPNLRQIGSAGSYFKNPIVSKFSFKKIKDEYPDIMAFPLESGYVKLSAGYILDKICKLKNFKYKKVGFYKKNALVMVNLGGAKSVDVIYLANIAKKLVKDKLGIEIEEEVIYLK